MPVGGNTGKWVNQKDQNIFANQSLLWLVLKFNFALYVLAWFLQLEILKTMRLIVNNVIKNTDLT